MKKFSVKKFNVNSETFETDVAQYLTDVEEHLFKKKISPAYYWIDTATVGEYLVITLHDSSYARSPK